MAGWWIGQRLQLSGDLRKFMPAPQTPAQKLLIDELGEGPGSRLLLVALSGDEPAALAAQSQAIRRQLGGSTLFQLVANGGDTGIEAIAPALRPYRYLLSDTLDTQPLDARYLRAQLEAPQGGGLSPLRYYYRECVDFVAWRLNRDAGSYSAPFKYDWGNLASGSAYAWKSAWLSHGWTVSDTPVPGAVAWFPGANHVAYVSGILTDGSVAIEEYNGMVKHGYAQRIIQVTDATYLYPPPR